MFGIKIKLRNQLPLLAFLRTNAALTIASARAQCLKFLAMIKLNKWHYDVVRPYKSIKDELTVTSKGVILRGSRKVMPKSLQQRAIDIAHETHPGLTKTKALIREKIWFPNIDKMVKDTVDRCIACQAVSRTSPQEPLTVTEMPK